MRAGRRMKAGSSQCYLVGGFSVPGECEETQDEEAEDEEEQKEEEKEAARDHSLRRSSQRRRPGPWARGRPTFPTPPRGVKF